MHSELRSLIKASEMLSRVEAKLKELGIASQGEVGGYANGQFGEYFGSRAAASLVWQVWLTPDVDDDEDEDLMVSDIEERSVDVDVGVTLHFGENSVVGISYDPELMEWCYFLGQADPDVKVDPEAEAFADKLGIAEVSENHDDFTITDERAFEVLVEMAELVKAKNANVEPPAEKEEEVVNVFSSKRRSGKPTKMVH